MGEYHQRNANNHLITDIRTIPIGRNNGVIIKSQGQVINIYNNRNIRNPIGIIKVGAISIDEIGGVIDIGVVDAPRDVVTRCIHKIINVERQIHSRDGIWDYSHNRLDQKPNHPSHHM